MIETEEITAEDCKYIITAPGLYCLRDASVTVDTHRRSPDFAGTELDFVMRMHDGTERVVAVRCVDVDVPVEARSVEMEASVRGYIGDEMVECYFQIGGSGDILIIE